MTRRVLASLAIAGVVVGAGVAASGSPGPSATAVSVPFATELLGDTLAEGEPCEFEDSPGPCWWDAQAHGNGMGTSFYRAGE